MRDYLTLARWNAADLRRPSSLLALAALASLLLWICLGIQEYGPENALAWPIRVWLALGAGVLAAGLAAGRRGAEHATDAYLASRPLARRSFTRYRVLVPLLAGAALFLVYLPSRLAGIERRALAREIAARPEQKAAIESRGRWMNTPSWNAARRLHEDGYPVKAGWHDWWLTHPGRFAAWQRESVANRRKELAADKRIDAPERAKRLESHRRWVERIAVAQRDYAVWKRAGGPLPATMRGAWFSARLTYAPYRLHCAAALVLFALGVAAGLGWSAATPGARGVAGRAVRRHLIPLALIAPSLRFAWPRLGLGQAGEDAARGMLSFEWSLGARLYASPAWSAAAAAALLLLLLALSTRGFRRADLLSA